MTFDHTVQIGAEVYTADGIRLGTVAELRDNAFRINTDLLPDYWLLIASAAFADGRSLRLNFPMQELGRHLIPAPPAD